MTTDQQSSQGEKTYPRPAYAWYVVILMAFFYVLSFMDRQIIAVLIDPIKADLDLSDVQISLIGGVSFGLFYSLVGIFIGRLADSMHRPWLIAMGVFIWSLTTAMCGLASKFWHLLVLRMGVGLGEAALLPSTLSLLTDYFPPKRLATPTSVFLLGAPIGIGLSFAVGGLLFGIAQDITAADGWNDVFFIGGSAAWKLVLMFLGVLGMVMTLGMLTVHEPRTSNAAAAREAGGAEPQGRASGAAVRGQAAYAEKALVADHVALHWHGADLTGRLCAGASGTSPFCREPTAWRRKRRPFPTVWCSCSAVSAACWSEVWLPISSARRVCRARAYKLVTIGAAIATPFSVIYPLMGSHSTSLALMVLAIFGSNMGFAGAAAAMQRMYPSTMLGLAAGFYFFMSNAVGLLVGPTAVAAITDYGFGDPGKVGYSLSIVGGSARLLAFVLFAVGLKAYVRLLREREGSVAA